LSITEIIDLCRRRASVRQFAARPVPAATLEQILEAGRWAATSSNHQARRFVVITDPAARCELVELAEMQEFLAEAPVLIVGWATEPHRRGSMADVFISLTQMEMAAVAAGLGTCWIGRFKDEAVTRFIGGPAGGRPMSLLAVGYPAGDFPRPKEKLPLSELVHAARFPDQRPASGPSGPLPIVRAEGRPSGPAGSL